MHVPKASPNDPNGARTCLAHPRHLSGAGLVHPGERLPVEPDAVVADVEVVGLLLAPVCVQ